MQLGWRLWWGIAGGDVGKVGGKDGWYGHPSLVQGALVVDMHAPLLLLSLFPNLVPLVPRSSGVQANRSLEAPVRRGCE